MPTGYQIDIPSNTYFLTFQVIDWVDVFSKRVYRDILLDSFSYCRLQKGLRVWAYVIMTNHIHCILSASNGNLPDVVRDCKRFTATHILKEMSSLNESRRDWMFKRFEFAAMHHSRNGKHQFWTHENHAEEITSLPFLNQKLNYIHMNPVEAGWVEKASDWMYSSMRNYCFLPALIEIDMLDLA